MVVNPRKKRQIETSTDTTPSSVFQRILPYDQGMLDSIGPRFLPLQTSHGHEITFFSELLIEGAENVDNAPMLFRAHPSFGETKAGWFDWAYIHWQGGEDDVAPAGEEALGDHLLVPGRFCLFADLRQVPINNFDNDFSIFADGPGIYAVLESFQKAPVKCKNVPSPPLASGCLDTYANGHRKYYFCNVTAIYRPAFVIQLNNLKRPLEYHVVLPPSAWWD